MKKAQCLKVLIGVTVIVLFLSIGLSMSSFASPYKHVSEVLADPDRHMAEEVQIAALIVSGTYARHGRISTFTITDGISNLYVVYDGNEPPAFREGTGVVVVGKLVASDLFKATMLLAKCPSKYEEKIRSRLQE